MKELIYSQYFQHEERNSRTLIGGGRNYIKLPALSLFSIPLAKLKSRCLAGLNLLSTRAKLFGFVPVVVGTHVNFMQSKIIRNRTFVGCIKIWYGFFNVVTEIIVAY